MAKADNSTRINIYINNDEAKRKLIELDEAYRSNAEALRSMTAAGQGSTDAAKALREANVKLGKEMDDMRRRAGLHALSYKEVRGEYMALLREYNRAIPGSEHRQKLAAQLKTVRDRLDELTESTKESSSGFGKLADGFNKYFALLGTIAAGITGVSMKFRELSEEFSKMDDTYSDVMKTTGMTRDEVVNLNEALKRMDTRTSREELNLLARDAGKLSITGKKDILDFVEAGNQIRVALGEDLGDDAIQNIGKLVDVFALSTKEMEAMDLKGKLLAVGSAINELGSSSSAGEGYMVNFAQRMGGVASQAGISIQDILGFASALDQSGQAAEMSATSLSKFIMKLYEEPAKFAKLAGLEVQSFSKLLREDANAAVKQVLKSLSEKGGFAQLVPVFQQLGLDGARAVGVLSSLATNIDKVTDAQATSNRAFAEGTSLTREYDVKNNNLQAGLEKAKKEFKEVSLALGERLNPALLKSTNGITYLIKALVALPEVVKKYGGAIAVATIGVVAYTVATRAASVATALMQSAVVKAGRAFLTNPWTIAIAGLALLVQAIYSVVTASTAAKDAYKEFSEEVGREQASAKMLFTALNDVNTTQERRKEIIDEINSRYGQYMDNLLSEKTTLEELKTAQDKVNTSLETAIAMKMRDSKVEEVIGKGVKEQVKYAKSLQSELAKKIGDDNAHLLVKQFRKVVDDGLLVYKEGALFQKFGDAADSIFKSFGLNIIKYQDEISDYYKQMKRTKAEVEAINKAFAMFEPKTTTTTTPPAATTPPPAGSGKPTEEPKDDYATALEKLKKYQEKRLMLAQEFQEKEREAESVHRSKLTSLELLSLLELLDLQKEHGEDTIKVRTQIAEKMVAKDKNIYGQRAKEVDKRLSEWLLHEKEALEAGQVTEEKHQVNVMKAELSRLEEQLRWAKMYREDTLNLEHQIADKRLAIQKNGYDAAVKALQAAQQEEVALLQQQRDAGEVSAEFFQQRMLAIEMDGLRERLALAKAAGKDTSALESEMAQKTAASVKNLSAIRKRLLRSELKERRDMELQFIKDSHEAGLLSDREYAQKSLAVWSEYAASKSKQVGDMATNVIAPIGAAVKAFEESEMADNNLRKEQRLAEATDEYNQKMALAKGDAEEQARIKEEFEDRKKQIDYEAAQANLDTQKKYADANFALQAAQAVVTGIVSAMQAYASMASIPVVGPALGAVAAAAVGVATVLQIASLNKERQRIKSVTLEAPTSSSGSPKTAAPEPPSTSSSASYQRVIKPEEVDPSTIVKGYAAGKYDVVSASDGRRYRAPLVRSVTGVVRRPTLVAEEPELVVGIKDFRYLERHVNFPLVLEAIGDARRQRTVPARAEGDYSAVDGARTGAQGASPAATPPRLLALIEKTERTMAETERTLAAIRQKGLHANIGVTELEAKQKRLQKARVNAE
jgi:TP901 family phage tail tape measure protein